MVWEIEDIMKQRSCVSSTSEKEFSTSGLVSYGLDHIHIEIIGSQIYGAGVSSEVVYAFHNCLVSSLIRLPLLSRCQTTAKRKRLDWSLRAVRIKVALC